MEQRYKLANSECGGINARVLVQNFRNASIIHKTNMSMHRVNYAPCIQKTLVTFFFFFFSLSYSG